MADRFPTQILIGGKLKRALLPEFIAQVLSQQFQSDYGMNLSSIGSEADLLNYRGRDGYLFFCHEEQAWGRFEDLEDFLMKNNIAFDRHHSSRYEVLGEVAKFRPGMKAPQVGNTDDHGNLLAEVLSIQKIRDRLRRDRGDKSIRWVLRKLNRLCLEADIEPPEPFEIVD